MKTINIAAIVRILSRQEYALPLAETVKERNKDALFILVSTILSARTKDSMTEKVCTKLFKKIRNAGDLEKIKIEELRKIIRPVNYYKNKARYLKELPAYIKDGVPSEIEELIKLPGVGRKTANIVRNVAFRKPAMPVDVHVNRIMNRLGYIKTKNPKETEFALRKKLPKKYWGVINYLLVMHGQNTCTPISPKCSNCPIRKYCNKIGVTKSR